MITVLRPANLAMAMVDCLRGANKKYESRSVCSMFNVGKRKERIKPSRGNEAFFECHQLGRECLWVIVSASAELTKPALSLCERGWGTSCRRQDEWEVIKIANWNLFWRTVLNFMRLVGQGICNETMMVLTGISWNYSYYDQKQNQPFETRLVVVFSGHRDRCGVLFTDITV